MTLKAISFDLWDTVFDDASDEPKRAQQGLPDKAETRHRMLLESLRQHHDVTREQVNLAYGVANAAFYKVWQEASITWTCRERLEVLLKGLCTPLPDDVLDELATKMGCLEVDIPPDIIPGVKDAIRYLSTKYKLCVTSDTIVTPSAGLRAILAHHGLETYFEGFAFSDEVGRSKPHPAMFQAACQSVGVKGEQALHIGDRDNKDIKGAQAAGMKAILFTAKRDADRFTTSADAVCEDHADLPGIVDALSKD